MVIRSLRAAAACALLATTAIASPAFAQNALTDPPHGRESLDENGVNYATGEQVQYINYLSIGPSGPGSLRYTRAIGHNASLNSYELGIYGATTSAITANAGLDSYAFTWNGSSFVSADGKGASLTKNGAAYTLLLADGTSILYQTQSLNDGDVRSARGAVVTYPTGEKVTLVYASMAWCDNTFDGCAGGTLRSGVRLQSVTSSLGYQLHYSYAADAVASVAQAADWKRLASITAVNTTVDACDPAAGQCSFTRAWPQITFDVAGGITDAVQHKTVYANGTSTFTIQRPSSSTANTTVNFDASNRVSSITREGVNWNYAFSLSGTTMTSTRTDSLNRTRTVVANTLIGLPTSITDELQHTTSFEYDGSGRQTKTTSPEGNFTQLTYDARGNVTQTRSVAKSGSGIADIVSAASYPGSCTAAASCNKPLSTTDARSNVTDYVWDGTTGNLVSVTIPAPTAGAVRPKANYGYTNVTTPGGTVVSKLTSVSRCQTQASCAGTADEVKQSVIYSTQLLPTSSTVSDGTGSLSATTAIGYDGVGNATSVDGLLAGTADTTIIRYDAARRAVGLSSPDPDGSGPLKLRAIRYAYNLDGQLYLTQFGTVTDPSDATWANFAESYHDTSQINGYTQVTRQVRSAGNVDYAVVDYLYDGLGRRTCQVVHMDPMQWGSQAASCTPGQINGSYGPDRVSKVSFDAVGRPSEIRSGVGTLQEAVGASYAYTTNGNLASLTDGNNNKTSYVYDGADRLWQTLYPSDTKGAGTSNGGNYEQLNYDAGSNIVSRRLRDGKVIGYTYDAIGRVTFKDLPTGESDVSYVYDNLSRVTAVTQPGFTVGFGYDALSRQIAESSSFGSLTRQFDLAGNITRTSWGDGFWVDYDRLVTGALSKVRENGATSGVGVLASYGYDDLGRRISLARGNGTVTNYGYDATSRLTSLTQDLGGISSDLTLGFRYNPAGQIAGTTRSNDAYAWSGAYNTTRNYGTNGLNQLVTAGSVTQTFDGRGNLMGSNGKTYTYTTENMLSAVTGGTTLYYDPLHRLVEYDTSVSKRFMFDGAHMAAELSNPAGAVQHRYVWGDGPDELLVDYDYSSGGSGVRSFVHADERGSVIALSDSSGNMVKINSYDEYGIPGANNGGRFLYTGQAWLSEIGMANYKARIYSPTDGRFIQTDPIGYGDGPNIYNYVGSDPINATDPSGRIAGREFGLPPTQPINPEIFVNGDICRKVPSPCGTGGDTHPGLRLSDGGFGSRYQFGDQNDAADRPQKTNEKEETKEQVCAAVRSAATDIRAGNKGYAAAAGAGAAYYVARHSIHAIHVARSVAIFLGAATRGGATGAEAGAAGGPWGAAAGALLGAGAGAILAYSEATGKTTVGADIADSAADLAGCRRGTK